MKVLNAAIKKVTDLLDAMGVEHSKRRANRSETTYLKVYDGNQVICILRFSAHAAKSWVNAHNAYPLIEVGNYEKMFSGEGDRVFDDWYKCIPKILCKLRKTNTNRGIAWATYNKEKNDAKQREVKKTKYLTPTITQIYGSRKFIDYWMESELQKASWWLKVQLDIPFSSSQREQYAECAAKYLHINKRYVTVDERGKAYLSFNTNPVHFMEDYGNMI